MYISLGNSAREVFVDEEKLAKIKAEELIKGIAIASGNDAAVAMAEFIAGSVEEFVNMMNKKGDSIILLNQRNQYQTYIQYDNSTVV